jgi:hypothetical protein
MAHREEAGCYPCRQYAGLRAHASEHGLRIDLPNQVSPEDRWLWRNQWLRGSKSVMIIYSKLDGTQLDINPDYAKLSVAKHTHLEDLIVSILPTGVVLLMTIGHPENVNVLCKMTGRKIPPDPNLMLVFD